MINRGVRGNEIYSSENPAIRIEVDKAFQYVGELKFTLMGVAWVEIYYFVEAEGAELKRTFHVQFEGYLPDNAHTYNYPSPQRVRLGQHEYIFDAAFGDIAESVKQRPDSDTAHGSRLLQEKGYNVAGMSDIMRERYVRLLDDARRNEILLIYVENLASFGLQAADLDENGKAASEWPRLQVEMHQRFLDSIKVFDA